MCIKYLWAVPLGIACFGCGGSSSSISSDFQGSWTGTGTIVNGATTKTGTVTMDIDGSGNVSGSDTVTLDGGQEIESGVLSSSGATLTLSESEGTGLNTTTNTYSVTATVSLNSGGQMVWSGTETIGTTAYTLTYTLTQDSAIARSKSSNR